MSITLDGTLGITTSTLVGNTAVTGGLQVNNALQVGGNTTVTGPTVFSNTVQIGNTAGTSQIAISGYNAYGGAGYHGFMSVVSQYASVTNPNKFFRINPSGGYEILNSAYSSIIYTLSDAGSITITGALGVGTAASGTAGEIRAANEVTAYYSSDANLKTNISPIQNALDKIDQLSGVMFDWKDEVIEARGGEDGYFVRKHDTGLIAQEVEAVLPEVVAERSDGTKAVKYEKLAGLLIEGIKELRKEIEILKAK